VFQDWADLDDGLPTHDDEMLAAHQGQPSISVQNRTHGAGIPPIDNGEDDQAKYGC
jgi:hypothetical protein